MAYFIFDLDGTLLSNSNVIPPKTWDFILQIKKMNHKLGVATGRPYESILEKIIQPDIFDVIIGYNGAQIKFGKKLIEYPFPWPELDDFIKNNNNSSQVIAISAGNTLYTDFPENAKDIINRLKPKILPLNQIHNENKIFVLRIISKNKEVNEKDFIEIKGKFDVNKFNVDRSTQIYTLVTNINANKLKALKILQKEVNEKIVFFGDSHNDLDVFLDKTLDSICVAPSNAINQIKKNANLVLSTSNDEGLYFNFELIE